MSNKHTPSISNASNATVRTTTWPSPPSENRKIARSVSVSYPRIAKVRKSLEKSGDVETVTTSVDTKGRTQPAKRRDPPTEHESTTIRQ